MITDEKIKRINELYHKSKAEGLTEEEKQEQAQLRNEYREGFRQSLKSNLDSIVIQYEDGTQVRLKDKYGKKNEE